MEYPLLSTGVMTAAQRITLTAVAAFAAGCGELTSGASELASGAATCNSDTGLPEPLPVCSPDDPCDRLVAIEPDGVATRPTELPRCRTGLLSDRPFYSDVGPRSRAGIDGTTRYWCEYRPLAAAWAPRPLVVFLHGAYASADNLYNATSLRTKAISYPLRVSRPGFILVSVQGRNLHWPTLDDRDGAHHDNFFRDLGSPSANPDVANVDAIIDGLVADGVVDTDRIYIAGWSNGGFFAQLYGIARHQRPTPGGNRIAAVFAYTAADPFNNAIEGLEPSCQLNPYPTSPVPVHLISRSCDLIACDRDQADHLADRGMTIAPGAIVEPWFDALRSEVGAAASWTRVDGAGNRVGRCRAPGFCPLAAASLNHIRWPDGVDDRSGVDYEHEILSFFRANPL